MDSNFCTALIAEVGQAILTTLELSGAETAGLMELDQACGWLRYTHGAGRDGARLLNHLTLRPGEGVVGRAIEQKAPAWSTDVMTDSRIKVSEEARARARRLQFRGILAAPLMLRGVARGALVVHFRQPHLFGEAEVDALATLAALASIALEN